MPRQFRSILPALVLLLSNQALCEWAEYKSDNFTLYSDIKESEALEVLENFELFRLATLTLLGLPDEPESERLKIFAYARGRDFARIRPGSNVGGFFYHSVFGPRMIIGPGGRRDDVELILFHEYVHYLMNSHAGINFPRWYSEGFATMLAAADITESSIVIGNSPPNFLWLLRLGFDASIYDLIDMKYDGTDNDFYRSSWLMTHYLVLDAENAPRRRASLLDYLRRYDAGEDPIEAFTAAFGILPNEMQRELELYGQRTSLTVIKLPRAPYSGELSRRPLTAGEELYRLGDLAVERDAYAAAHGYFDEFEARAGESPFAANVRSRRAIAYVHQRRVDEGDALIEPLLAMETEDADVLADIAHFSYDRFVNEREESPDEAATHLQRSIDYGARAVELNPGDVEALYYLGLAYEAAGRLQLAADTLFKSHDINPSAPRLNLALIRLMIKGRQPEVASYLVSRLYSASHSEEMRARLLELRQDIEEGDVDLEAFLDLIG